MSVSHCLPKNFLCLPLSVGGRAIASGLILADTCRNCDDGADGVVGTRRSYWPIRGSVIAQKADIPLNLSVGTPAALTTCLDELENIRLNHKSSRRLRILRFI